MECDDLRCLKRLARTHDRSPALLMKSDDDIDRTIRVGGIGDTLQSHFEVLRQYPEITTQVFPNVGTKSTHERRPCQAAQIDVRANIELSVRECPSVWTQ